MRWKGYSESDDTWEPENQLKQDVPGLLKEYKRVLRDRDKEKETIGSTNIIEKEAEKREKRKKLL